MGELSSHSGDQRHLDYYGNRTTENDLILGIGRDLIGGELEVVPIDANGARPLISGNEPAKNAYFHPSVTPGLEAVVEDTLWDQALDELNELGDEDKAWALQHVEKTRRKGLVGPTLVFDAIKRQTRHGQIDKAA